MKKPFLNLEKIQDLTKQYPTPFYIYDEKGLRENMRLLSDAFSWNKGFKQYFAVKANCNPKIIKILKEEGSGVDCSSYAELYLAKKLGFDGDEIFFSSNNTPAEEFIYAKGLGATINMDDITHIEFLEKHAGLPEEICLRYNPGQEFSSSNAIMDKPENAKFGMTKTQIIRAYQVLKQKGIKRFGIHAFLVSNSLGEVYYPALAKFLFEFAVELKNEHDIILDLINLSGGIGIPYHPTDKKTDILKVGEDIKLLFEKILVPAGLENISLCTELGRFISAPYGQLITKAVHQKNIYKEYIGVDACACNLMRPAIYKAYHHITVLGKESNARIAKYDIVGSLCENNDKFAIDRILPKIDIGDYLVIHDAGGHGYSMGYNYNGKLKCAELLLKQDGTIELIRRAETLDDYFATVEL